LLRRSTVSLSRILLAIFVSMVFVFTEACGGRQATNCGNITGITVSPLFATADHADPDTSQQIFTSILVLQGGPGCPELTPASTVSTWTANDPAVQLSPTTGESTTATCVAAAPGNITITATATLSTGQVSTAHGSLFCR
jgi:hypothetical protein